MADSTCSKSNMDHIEEAITKLTSNHLNLIATQNPMSTQHINHALDVSREEVGGKTHSNEVTTAIGAGDSDGGDEFSHTTIWSASNFVGGILTLLSP